MSGIFELEAATQWSEPENLLIVDTLNLCFRYKHRGQTDFSAELLSTINSFAKSYNCKDVMVLSDFKGSKYRKALDPNYKGARKEKFKDQTPEEEAKAVAFFDAFEESLEFVEEYHPVIRMEGVEADDVAGFLVKALKGHYKNIWLISTDRDWDLLLDSNVHRFSYITRREYTLENFWEEHGCDSPEQYISMKVLQGDAGDSVQGIAGVGTKRAYALTREYGSAMDLYCEIPLAGKQKFIQNLNASGELILLNYQLMDLLTYCEDAITFADPENLEKLKRLCINVTNKG